jgi:hypothetical protein
MHFNWETAPAHITENSVWSLWIVFSEYYVQDSDVTLPDLNMWNYYLQGHFKESVYRYNSYIVKGLQIEICNVILEISKYIILSVSLCHRIT